MGHQYKNNREINAKLMDIPYSLHMPQILSLYFDKIRGINHRMKKKLIPQILSLHFDKIWGINASNIIITFDPFWGINTKKKSFRF